MSVRNYYDEETCDDYEDDYDDPFEDDYADDDY